ncbi:MAG: hypothetical protein ABI760_19790 [Ferruginibacter sp.]
MKTHHLFFCVMLFITCCVFTWKAESTSGQLLGFIALVVSILSIGKIIVSKLNA